MRDKQARQARKGDTVKIHFTCRFADGTVVDSSIGSEPLQFTIGAGQMLQEVEKAMVGMGIGELKTIYIPAENAYGSHRIELVQTIRRDELPKDLQPEVGMQLHIEREDSGISAIRVSKVTDMSITLDANHPLAGKDLIFAIKLIEIISYV